MNHNKHLTLRSAGSLISLLAVFLLAGCQSSKQPVATTPEPATTATAAAETTPAPVAAAPAATTAAPAAAAPEATPAPATNNEAASVAKIIRIDAGASGSYTDSVGNVWLPDQGFADGDTADRGDALQITNTPDQAIYRTEHYGMTAFSQAVPNGKYTVKLHFAETYSEITGEGQRVFSVTVGGHELKDIDVWKAAGGAQTAYVETVNDVIVTDGKLDITFTTNIQSPEINGIEIIPAQ
jgi:hypothetical protein